MESMLRSKGIHTMDDLDAPEEEPLLELQSQHQLIFIVEVCQAKRPSKLGSLKGSHEKYLDELARLEKTVEDLKGEGTLEVIEWQPGMPVVPSSGSGSGAPVAQMSESMGRRSRPQSAGLRPGGSRPQSAAASSRAHMGGSVEERAAPRIGAFEVSYKLVNTTSGQQYGPVEVFSKIGSGHWPGPASQLINRVQKQLQVFLQSDLGGAALYQHVSHRAAAAGSSLSLYRSPVPCAHAIAARFARVGRRRNRSPRRTQMRRRRSRRDCYRRQTCPTQISQHPHDRWSCRARLQAPGRRPRAT